jgi:hypothetical protein
MRREWREVEDDERQKVSGRRRRRRDINRVGGVGETQIETGRRGIVRG